MVWGGDFAAQLTAIGIKSVTTPIRAPNANSIRERVVGSLRRECLDHIIILGERHLSTVLAEFVAYYNHDRPYRTLGLETPVSSGRLMGIWTFAPHGLCGRGLSKEDHAALLAADRPFLRWQLN